MIKLRISNPPCLILEQSVVRTFLTEVAAVLAGAVTLVCLFIARAAILTGDATARTDSDVHCKPSDTLIYGMLK